MKVFYVTLMFAVCLWGAAIAQGPQEYTLKLTPQQLDYTYNLLSEQKYKDVQVLLDAIRQQVVAQNQAAAKLEKKD